MGSELSCRSSQLIFIPFRIKCFIFPQVSNIFWSLLLEVGIFVAIQFTLPLNRPECKVARINDQLICPGPVVVRVHSRRPGDRTKVLGNNYDSIQIYQVMVAWQHPPSAVLITRHRYVPATHAFIPRKRQSSRSHDTGLLPLDMPKLGHKMLDVS